MITKNRYDQWSPNQNNAYSSNVLQKIELRGIGIIPSLLELYL